MAELKSIHLYKGIKSFSDVFTIDQLEPEMDENITPENKIARAHLRDKILNAKIEEKTNEKKYYYFKRWIWI